MLFWKMQVLEWCQKILSDVRGGGFIVSGAKPDSFCLNVFSSFDWASYFKLALSYPLPFNAMLAYISISLY